MKSIIFYISLFASAIFLLIMTNCHEENPSSPNEPSVTTNSSSEDDYSVYVVGSQGFSDMPYSWWIKKFDSKGNEDTENWDKVYKEIYFARANAAALDSMNNLFVSGLSESSYNDSYYGIRKFDEDGNEDTKTWESKVESVHGSTIARSMVIDNNDNIYLSGNVMDMVFLNGSNFIKLDSKGNKIGNWDIYYENLSVNQNGKGFAIDSTGNIYAIPYETTPHSTTDRYICKWNIKKFSPDGTEDVVNWNKVIGDDESFSLPISIDIDKNDNVYIAGYYKPISDYNYGCWTVKKFSKDGVEDMRWNKYLSSDFPFGEAGYSIVIDSRNDVYVGGTQCTSYDRSNYYWWIRKFNSEGIEYYHWNKILSNNDKTGKIYNMALDRYDNLYVVGQVSDSSSSCNGSGCSSSNYDWCIRKFDNNGTEDVENWNKIIDGKDGKDDFPFDIVITK